MKDESARILIVDDEKDIRGFLARLMEREGFKATVAYDGYMALRIIPSEMPDVMLVDFKMPNMDGMELLKRAKEMDPDLPVIMITAYADIQGAVDAMKAGAQDYLAKPFKNDEVITATRRAIAQRRLKEKRDHLPVRFQEIRQLREMMGPSDKISELISQVNRVASSVFTVVLEGETGSGKELVARAIHSSNPQVKGPFVPVDCGAIPESLFENDLFGHEKGAFTDATQLKPGKFEAARGGTLFLDEISNLPMGSQAKLLRVLQEKTLYRLGSTKPVPIDTRVLVATNRDLSKAVASGSFRQDLFYRLNEFSLRVPSLRERREDIPYLARRFLEMTNLELGKEVIEISEKAMEVLIAFDWPGNVRQLRSTIRRAVLLADKVISERHLELHAETGPNGRNGREKRPFKLSGDSWRTFSLREIVQDNTRAVERDVLTQAMRYTGGNKAKAARLLQIDYKTMHTKLKQLGISTNGGVKWSIKTRKTVD